MTGIKLGVGASTFKSTVETKKPVAKKPAPVTPVKAPAAPAKAPATADKATLEKNLKDAAKITTTLCEILKKKIIGHKSASAHEPTEVCGFKKNDLMKLIETLDAMGTATYNTSCVLRDLHNRMQ